MSQTLIRKKRRAAHAWLSFAIIIVLAAYRYSIHVINQVRSAPQEYALGQWVDWLELAALIVLLAVIWFSFTRWRTAAMKREQVEKEHREKSRLLQEMQEKYDQLKELEDLRDNLTFMIVHDLKTPLTAISGYQDILMRYSADKLDENEQGYLNECCKQTSRLASMISSVLDVTKLESNEMVLNLEPCDLIPIAEEAVDSLGAISASLVKLEPASRPVIAYCDPEVVGRIVQNLLDNAVKSTPGEGTVTVRLKNNGKRTVVSVTDTGSGVPEEYREKIFEKFGRVKVKKYSTGLGLTFCKLAVEAHGGTIQLESEVGKGSTFKFDLPAKPPVD